MRILVWLGIAEDAQDRRATRRERVTALLAALVGIGLGLRIGEAVTHALWAQTLIALAIACLVAVGVQVAVAVMQHR
jgi:hypothetical protein